MENYIHSFTIKKLASTLIIIGLCIMGFTIQMLPTSQSTIARAAPATTLNPVQQENMLPGTPDWQITNPAPLDTNNDTHDKAIEGYPSQTSVMEGGTMKFAVSTVTSTFNADIYRLGWYQGDGARLEMSITNIPGNSYPVPAPDPKTGLIDANWPWAFSVLVPTSWVSGMYLVKLTDGNGEQIYVPFVVKSPQKSDLVLVHTANTDEAYNFWGGDSLYVDNTHTLSAGRAFKVSFDRPFYLNQGTGYLFFWEYPMLRFLERNGYDVSYISDEDVNNSQTNVLMGYKGVLIVGHSEYWTTTMRDNLQKAINSGVNLGAFSANDIYWQIRYQSSPSSGANRIIVCYKDASLDPLSPKNPRLTTVQFRSPPISRPEQTLLGQMSISYLQGNGYPWVASDASSWVFGGTNMQNGASLAGLVGYEFDQVFPQEPQPKTIVGADGVAGVEVLAASTVTDVYNNQVIANSTLYTAPSGARVFDMGTIQWSWGLDDWSSLYNRTPNVVNATAQQITANILSNFITGSIAPAPPPVG